MSNDELRTSFERDGFVSLPGFLNSAEIDELRAQLARFESDVLPTMPGAQVFYEDRHDASTLKQDQQLGEHDPWFGSMIGSGRFRELAETLLGDAVVPKNLQYFNKPALTSHATPAHQDGYYFMLEPCEALTMWLALDTVDEDNGCIRYVRASHRDGLRAHSRTTTLGFSQGLSNDLSSEDLRAEVAIHAEPGDLLVHHALTVHRAGANRSRDRSRRALGLIYYGASAREDAAAHARYQRRLAAELEAQGRI